MSQLEIDKWAHGKPPVLALFCQQLACSADDLHEILSFTKTQKHIPKLPEAAPKEWLRLYRNHRLLEQRLLNAFMQFGTFAEFAAAFYSIVRAHQRKPPAPSAKQAPIPGQDQQTKIDAGLQEIYQANLADIDSDFKNLPPDEETRRKGQELFASQEFLFFCKVFLPCQLLYGTTPFQLIRRARLGNLEALEQLIRLDKLVLADPGIMRQTQRLLHHNKYRYDSVVAKAIKDAPKFRLVPRQIRYLLAGLISLFSEAFSHKLEEPEIRALFDAVAHGKSSGATAIDTALPDSPETFSKAIQRERAFWKPILFPDKTL